MHRWLVWNIFCRFFNFHIKRKRDCRFHQGKMMRRQSFILLFRHCFISMWNNVDDVWTICGSKNGSTRPLWTMWTIFREKSVMKKFFLEKKNQKYCPQSHADPTPPPLPGKGNSSEEYFRSPSLALLWHKRSHLSRVRRHRIGGSALDRWFRLCKLCKTATGNERSFELRNWITICY